MISCNPVMEPSLISDPAFAKLLDLKHAETCEKIKIVGWRALYYITLAKYMRIPFCPICRKQEFIRRIEPGKGPRNEEEDQEEDGNNEKMISPFPSLYVNPYYMKTRKRKLLGAATHSVARDDFAISRERMRWIRHMKSCRWDYCCKQCYWTKSLITHVKECPSWECKRAGCSPTKELLMHSNNCRLADEMCSECGEMPQPGLYIERQAVNYRVHNFFKYPREMKGMYTKKSYAHLRIEKLADGSTIFRFHNNLDVGSGYANIFSKTGERKRFSYSAKHREEAHQYIVSNFGLLEHALALQKFAFENLFLGSIKIDDQLKSFINRFNSTINVKVRSKKCKKVNSYVRNP